MLHKTVAVLRLLQKNKEVSKETLSKTSHRSLNFWQDKADHIST